MISVAIQKGSYVHVYDEMDRQIAFTMGELVGYTSGSYSIKKGNYIHTYDEKGRQISFHMK